MKRDPAEGGQASVHKWKHQGPTWPHVPTHKPTGEDNKVSHSHRQLHPELQQVDNTFIMLFLPTFLIFVALSVSAIPLPRTVIRLAPQAQQTLRAVHHGRRLCVQLRSILG